MRSTKRTVIEILIVVGSLLVAASSGAQPQQQYPTKPVRVIVGLAPGGGVDATTRAMAHKLTEAWGHQVIVDNRPGATQAIALDLTAKAAPDGYTICIMTGATTINSAINRELPYDLIRDFAAISQVSTAFYVVFVGPSLSVRSVRDLIEYARTNPGKVIYGSSGTGGSQHLAWETFRLMTGTELVHVPYKGAPAFVAAMLAGEVHVGMSSLIAARPHLSSGRVRALAITAKDRSPSVPELPTVAEVGVPGYEANQWVGAVTGAKVAPAIIRSLNNSIATAIKSPVVVQRLAADGSTAVSTSPEEFAEMIKAEIAKWRRLVTDAKLVLR